MIGKTISHYKISDKLGEGGMGVVYKAEDTKLRRTVALKFLSQQAWGGEEEKTRFVREAQAAAALEHSNICTTYEIDEAEGQTFIAMAYVDGQSVEEKIRRGPVNPDEARNIAIQVAEGLQEAHENGIIHRDIKSANIMINRKGQARIMDFGLARQEGRTRLTQAATIMGTVAYMSPEQACGEPVDNRSDIWSLGIVLYEMLTGRIPFKAGNDAALLHKIIYEDPPDMRSLNPNVPPGLIAVVGRTMIKNKIDRYSSASEFLDDIRGFESLPAPEPRPVVQIGFADNSEVYAAAKKRVTARIRFRRHLAVYIFINSLLLIINLLTSVKYLWVKWPLFALGIPLFLHGLVHYYHSRESTIRDRMIEEEVSKISRKGN